MYEFKEPGSGTVFRIQIYGKCLSLLVGPILKVVVPCGTDGIEFKEPGSGTVFRMQIHGKCLSLLVGPILKVVVPCGTDGIEFYLRSSNW